MGEKALAGIEEYLPSHLFGAVEFDRSITGRGKLIMIFDPKEEDNTPPLWKHTSPTGYGTHTIPAGFKIKINDAVVKMTKSEAA